MTSDGRSPEELLAAALDATPSGIVLCDRELRVVGANRAAERIVSHSLPIGAPLSDALPGVSEVLTDAIAHVFVHGADSEDLEETLELIRYTLDSAER